MLTYLLAADRTPTSVDWIPAVTALVVFIAFFLVLARKVWPPLLKGLEDRQTKIREEIEAAEAARAQANEALAEYEENLAKAKQEASEMIARARADAKAVAEELRSRNETELSEMKDRATREIAAARQAAITEIHSETAGLAAAIAAKILKREISSDDQQRLVEESLAELAKVD